MNVPPVRTEVGSVPLEILAVPANVGPIARDVALLVLARALLGVLLPQSAFVVTQVRAIPLDVPTVCPDVRPVARDVVPITGHIVTIAVAAIRLTTRLLVTAIGVPSESRGIYLRASL